MIQNLRHGINKKLLMICFHFFGRIHHILCELLRIHNLISKNCLGAKLRLIKRLLKQDLAYTDPEDDEISDDEESDSEEDESEDDELELDNSQSSDRKRKSKVFISSGF